MKKYRNRIKLSKSQFRACPHTTSKVGITVKKVGNKYYLYKHSSKRVHGKKNPIARNIIQIFPVIIRCINSLSFEKIVVVGIARY